MDDLYLTVNTTDGTTLCLAPLSDCQIARATQELPDTSGYFLFEKHGSGELERIEILAIICQTKRPIAYGQCWISAEGPAR